MHKRINYLQLKFTTWDRCDKEYEIFDSKSHNIVTCSFDVKESMKYAILRKGSQVFLQNTQKVTSQDLQEYKFLADIKVEIDNKRDKTDCWFIQQTLTKFPFLKFHKPALVLNENSSEKDHLLKPGKTIKMGRIQYHVLETKIKGKVSFPKKNFAQLFPNYIVQKDEKTKNACRICLDDSDSPEDLLLNPCQCMGSCGTIHLQCLREWVSIKKLIKYKDEFTEIDFSKIKCEICKSPFYSMFQYKGLNSFLIQLKRPRDNYVILESESHTGVRKAIILHDLPSSGVSLGRFSKSHIFDDDKTISRSQSFFKKVQSEFYVFDNGSKYGTIIIDENEDRDFVKIDPNKKYQINRTRIQIKKMKKYEK